MPRRIILTFIFVLLLGAGRRRTQHRDQARENNLRREPVEPIHFVYLRTCG